MATNSNILSFTYDGSPVFYTLNTVLGVQHNETSASTASTLAEYTLGKDISPLISMRRLLNNMEPKDISLLFRQFQPFRHLPICQ